MESIYQFKIEIRESQPSIWRRIYVASDTIFSEFRDIIHIVFQSDGDIEDYEFTINKLRIIDFGPEIDDDQNPELKDSNSTFLDDYVNFIGLQFTFHCGRIHHDIVLEQIFPDAENILNPCCISGERACPPEGLDIMTYQNIIGGTFTNPELQEEANALLGPDFDPGRFDQEEVNNILQQYAEEWEEIYDEVEKMMENDMDGDEEDEDDENKL